MDALKNFLFRLFFFFFHGYAFIGRKIIFIAIKFLSLRINFVNKI